jgi:hypothetical protein
MKTWSSDATMFRTTSEAVAVSATPSTVWPSRSRNAVR